MPVPPPLILTAWLLSGVVVGLVLGLALGWWLGQGRRARLLPLLTQAQRSEAGLKREVQRLRELQAELRGRLADGTARHSQQLEQLKIIHAAAMSHADEELRRAQAKLLHLIDAFEQGRALSPNAFLATQLTDPPAPAPGGEPY